MSLPYTALCVGTGEMLLRGTPEAYVDTESLTGPEIFEPSSDKGMVVIGRNDLVFASLILFRLISSSGVTWVTGLLSRVTLLRKEGKGHKWPRSLVGPLLQTKFIYLSTRNLLVEASKECSRSQVVLVLGGAQLLKNREGFFRIVITTVRGNVNQHCSLCIGSFQR